MAGEPQTLKSGALIIMLIVLTAALLLSGVQTYSACGNPIIRSVGGVMCCCQTFGGMCCKELNGVCPGVFIRGLSVLRAHAIGIGT
jgi:hypothetical protein